mmetsp:Transcript_66220/g.186479  ORF Transcript_66220/g.186479 Transcript_66220/m.186479 type:complete len:255 (+) Transcript_66220:134-898(+)
MTARTRPRPPAPRATAAGERASSGAPRSCREAPRACDRGVPPRTSAGTWRSGLPGYARRVARRPRPAAPAAHPGAPGPRASPATPRRATPSPGGGPARGGHPRSAAASGAFAGETAAAPAEGSSPARCPRPAAAPVTSPPRWAAQLFWRIAAWAPSWNVTWASPPRGPVAAAAPWRGGGPGAGGVAFAPPRAGVVGRQGAQGVQGPALPWGRSASGPRRPRTSSGAAAVRGACTQHAALGDQPCATPSASRAPP